MRYNTGKASHQISAGERAAFAEAWQRGKPTFRQKKYLAFLTTLATENGIDIARTTGLFKIVTIQDHTIAISRLKKALIDAGVQFEDTARKMKSEKQHHERMKKRTIEALQTNWIYMTERKPDRPMVKTLDEDGRMQIYDWNGKNFIDCYGNPVVTGRHRNKTPIAWARLG